MDLPFDLTREQREIALESLKRYFAVERDEEIGTLAAELLLRHFIETVGPLIYNSGLDTAREWYTRRFEDLEVDFSSLRLNEPR